MKISTVSPLYKRDIPSGIYVYWLISLSILALLATRILFQYSSDMAFTVFLLMLYAIVLLLRFEEKTVIVITFPVFIVVKLVFLFMLNPVNNPDARNFIGYYDLFSGYSEFFNHFLNDLITNHINAEIYNTFGVLYISFFEIIGSTNPVAFNVYNTILTVATPYLVYKIVKKHFAYEVDNKTLFMTIFVSLCILSPSLLHWSSIVRKDITILFFTVLSLHLLLEKRFVWFLIVSLYAFTIRSYTIIPVLLYLVLFKKLNRAALCGTLLSVVVVFYQAGALGVANTFYTLGISLLSPNPFSLENWGTYGYRTLESVVVLMGLLLSLIVFLRQKDTRPFYYILFCCILAYTCVLSLVGYDAAVDFGIEYGFAVSGDDLARKKLMIVFMMYMMIAYSVAKLRKGK